MANLSLHAPYDGSDELIIGDGSGLPIANTGSLSFHSSSFSFTLNNVLHVPSASCNIISISQFCRDNNVSLVFLLNSLFVKDPQTEKILLQGHSKSGIYALHLNIFSPRSPVCHVSLYSAIDWHHRLGHPSLSILKHINSVFNLSISSTSPFHCNACDCNKSRKLPFSQSTIDSHGPLDVIYSDVWTSPIQSYDGYRYYIIFVITILNMYGSIL